MSFIFRIVSACAHLKEYTVANLSHRNTYIDKVGTYSTFSILNFIIFQNILYQIIPAQIRGPICSICRKMSHQKSKFGKSVQYWSELLAHRYDELKSYCSEGITLDFEILSVRYATYARSQLRPLLIIRNSIAIRNSMWILVFDIVLINKQSSKPVGHNLVESKKKRQRPNTNYTPNR